MPRRIMRRMFLDPDQCYRALAPTTPASTGASSWAWRTTRIYCRPVCTAKTPHRAQLPLLPERGGGGGARLSPVPALPAGARAGLRRGRREPPPRAGRGAADRGRAAGGREPRRSRRDARRDRPPPAPRLPAGVRRLARRVRADAAAAARQAAAHRHALPVIEVAMASGFASLRRFNDLFRTRYRMTPGELRRTAPARAPTETASPSTSPTARPTTGPRCSPSSSGARSPAWRRSMARAIAARSR